MRQFESGHSACTERGYHLKNGGRDGQSVVVVDMDMVERCLQTEVVPATNYLTLGNLQIPDFQRWDARGVQDNGR